MPIDLLHEKATPAHVAEILVAHEIMIKVAVDARQKTLAGGGEIRADCESELADIRVMLALWRRAWPTAQTIPSRRALLPFQAQKWPDQWLDYAGLLDTPK
jgi:hypothetical protein